MEHGGIAVALLPNSDYNIIEYNILNTTITSWDAFHETVALFAADYNIIRNNIVYCGDDNGIYASIYGRSGGVKSCYNQIINNTVICQVDNPSAWNYGIQLMGDYNSIINNTVKNCYRAISTTAGAGNIVTGNIIDTVIGDMGIYSTTNSLVNQNTLTNINSDYGIYVGDGTIVENNNVDVLGSSIGLSIGGSNVLIRNNSIKSNGGATIYGMGNYNNVTIINNDLTSNAGLVIQLKRQSSKKYLSDIKILDNTLTSNANIIVDAREAKTPFVFEGNTYPSSARVLIPENTNSSTNGTGFNGKTVNVTPDNYDDYFDATGIIRPNALNDGDTVYFIGEFNNKTLSINKRLKLTGNNPVFTNSIFRIFESGSWIENITIINSNPSVENQWGIFISGANNVTVLGNNIEVSDVCTAYAIYILDSTSDVIKGNVFKSSGEFLTYTVLAYEVSDLEFTNNIIYTNGTSELYNFTSSICIDGTRLVPEIYRTYAFLGIYISNSLISNNSVNAGSGLNVYAPETSTNSIVGIDLYYESNNNLVSYNNISIKALDSYIYGLGVLGSEMGAHSFNSSNNNFTSNIVNIDGTYFATGIIVGSDSYNTLMDKNIINLNAQDFTYGLTFESSSTNLALDNTIKSSGSANYLVELYSANNNSIVNNDLFANGTNSYGIAGYNAHNNLISSNTIKAYKIDSVAPVIVRHSDVIRPGTSGVYFMEDSFDNTVAYNTIVTNADYAVNLSNSSANVFSNALKSSLYSGDSAVYPLSSNVGDNIGVDDKSVLLSLLPLVKVYGSSDKLVGSILDANGNPVIGHHVSVTLTRPSSGASKNYDVVSDFTGMFSLDINLAPGRYTASAVYAGTSDYNPASSDVVDIVVNAEASNKTDTVLHTSDYSEPFGATKSFVGVLSSVPGIPVIGHHVSVTLTRLSSGASKTYDVVCDYNGEFSLDINLACGEYSVACSYAGTDIYGSCSSYNTMSIY